MVTAETCPWLLVEEERGVAGTAGRELSLTSVTELTPGQEVLVPRVISPPRSSVLLLRRR